MLLNAESIDYYSVKLPNGLLFAAIVYNMKKKHITENSTKGKYWQKNVDAEYQKESSPS